MNTKSCTCHLHLRSEPPHTDSVCPKCGGLCFGYPLPVDEKIRLTLENPYYEDARRFLDALPTEPARYDV